MYVGFAACCACSWAPQSACCAVAALTEGIGRVDPMCSTSTGAESRKRTNARNHCHATHGRLNTSRPHCEAADYTVYVEANERPP